MHLGTLRPPSPAKLQAPLHVGARAGVVAKVQGIWRIKRGSGAGVDGDCRGRGGGSQPQVPARAWLGGNKGDCTLPNTPRLASLVPGGPRGLSSPQLHPLAGEQARGPARPEVWLLVAAPATPTPQQPGRPLSRAYGPAPTHSSLGPARPLQGCEAPGWSDFPLSSPAQGTPKNRQGPGAKEGRQAPPEGWRSPQSLGSAPLSCNRLYRRPLSRGAPAGPLSHPSIWPAGLSLPGPAGRWRC